MQTTNPSPDRLDIALTLQEHSAESNSLTTLNPNIEGVKTYGRIWGRVLAFLGFASKIDENIYVNRRSFFQHLVEAWCATHERGYLRGDRAKINRMAQNIENDSTLDASVLTETKIVNIFFKCQNEYITAEIMGEQNDGKNLFE